VEARNASAPQLPMNIERLTGSGTIDATISPGGSTSHVESAGGGRASVNS
jgi:hypothetical protein